MKFATGCSSIDAMLEGGVEGGVITEVYGESGSGKTNLCLSLAIARAREGARVIFIDTEGVSIERFDQMCGDDGRKVKKMILFSEVKDFEAQIASVDKAVKIGMSNEQVGLIVVDTITGLFRREKPDEDGVKPKGLADQVHFLLQWARHSKKPVLVTSQVYSDVQRDIVLPLGGHQLHINSKAIIELQRVHGKPGVRKAIVRKHRHIPEGRSAGFRIEQEGLCALGGERKEVSVPDEDDKPAEDK